MCYTEDALLALDTDDFVTKKKLYEKMGDGACALHNYDKAIDYYLKMLEMAEVGCFDKKELIPVYVSLYQTYTDLKQYDDALLYLRKEQELNKDDPKESITTLIQIGDVYDLSGKGFWEIENVYQEARSEAQKLHDLRLEKRIGIKQIDLRKKHNMSTLVEILVDELKMSGIDITSDDADAEDGRNDVEQSSETSESEKNTPDIGEDISLSDISGSECDEDKMNTSISRTRKKRGQSFAIKRNEKGETQLHQACISGNLQQAIRLLDQGHAVNIRDHAGWTPLHEASNHGFVDVVKVLLDRGAAINDKGGKSCDGITALHDACVNGCLEVVEVLLDHGAQPTLRTDFNDTALDCLEKWKETATLSQTEQIFYEVIKERIVKMLNTAGCVDVTSPINSSHKRSTCSLPGSTTKKNKIGTLRNSAYVYSDSDDDNECVTVAETVDDIMNKEFPSVSTQSEFKGRNEYRSAMENVRKGNRLSLGSPAPITESKRKPGLLSADEVGESWLDEDVQTKKKRKLSSITRTFSHSDMDNVSPAKTLSKSKVNYDSTDWSKENIAVNLFDCDEAYTINDEDSHDAFDVLMSNAATSGSSNRKRRVSSGDSRNKNSMTSKQPTLLNNGFTKITQLSSNLFGDNDAFSPVKISLEISPKKSSPLATKMASIKVKVEDHSLNVPVSNVEDLTVGWLGILQLINIVSNCSFI